MTVYIPLAVKADDDSYVKLPDWYTVPRSHKLTNVGPPFSPVKGELFIQNFQPPEFLPVNPTIINRVGHQGFVEKCPLQTVLLRNEWETSNITNAVEYGGFDQYNIHNIPSCYELDSSHMNFMDSTKPFGRIMVDGREPPNFDWVTDSHGYSNSPW